MDAEVQAGAHPGRYYHTLDDGRVQCDICPRFCKLRDGQRIRNALTWHCADDHQNQFMLGHDRDSTECRAR